MFRLEVHVEVLLPPEQLVADLALGALELVEVAELHVSLAVRPVAGSEKEIQLKFTAIIIHSCSVV